MARWFDVIKSETRSGFIRKSQSAEGQYPAAKFWIYRYYFFSFSFLAWIFEKKAAKKWNCFLIEWLNPAELGLKFVYTSNMFHKMKANRKIFGCHEENEKVFRLACLIAFVPSAQENLFLKLWINSLGASSVESKIILDINWENLRKGCRSGMFQEKIPSCHSKGIFTARDSSDKTIKCSLNALPAPLFPSQPL